MPSVKKHTLNGYFDLLEDNWKEVSANLPSEIYNVDETGVRLDPGAPKIAIPKGIKRHDISHLEGNGKLQW